MDTRVAPVMPAVGLLGLLLALASVGLEPAARFALAGDAHWRRERMRKVIEDVSHTAYTNDPVAERVSLAIPEITGSAEPVVIYPLQFAGRAAGAAVELTAVGAYHGTIRVLVGIDAKGAVTGVLPLEHAETPGIGDAIDPDKSDWRRIFDGRSRANPEARGWELRTAGGEFDALSGATITSRAMIRGVLSALNAYQEYERRGPER
jgi:electron transport complex protein RnfG